MKLKFLYTFLLVVVIQTAGFATTYYSIASGDWNLNTTWSLTNGGPAVGAGVFPTATDDVVITSGKTVTVTADAFAKSISIQGILTINNGKVLTVRGNVDVANGGQFNAGTGNNDTTTIKVFGDFTNTGTANFWKSNVIIAGNLSTTSTILQNNGNIIVGGNVTASISGGGNGFIYPVNPYATVSVSGTSNSQSAGTTPTDGALIDLMNEVIYGGTNCNASAGSVSSNFSTLCVGNTMDFSSNGWSTGGSWSSSNPSVLTIDFKSGTSGNGVATGIAPGKADVIYTVKQSGCVDKISKKTITVANGVGSIDNISGVNTPCSSSNGNVYSVSPVVNATAYTWILPNGWSIISGANTNSITVSLANNAAEGNVEVYASDACGGRTISKYFYTHVGTGQATTPTVNPSGSTTFCSGSSVTLTSSSGETYLWSTGATTQSIIVNSSGSYWVKVTQYQRCLSNSSTPISVTVTSSVSASSSTPTVCVNTAIPTITHVTSGFTGISNSGVSGANGLPTGVSATFANNTITISGTPTVSGSFLYSIQLTGGCGTGNATGTITVKSDSGIIYLNGTPITSGTITYSETSPATFSISPISGAANYIWTVPAGWKDENGVALTNPVVTNTPVLKVITGIYPQAENVVVTASNLFCPSSAKVTLTSIPPSAPTLGSKIPVTCGALGSISLNGLPVSGVWTVNKIKDGTTSLVIANNSGGSYTVNNLSAGDYTFTVTNIHGVSLASATINIPDMPTTIGTWDGTKYLWDNGDPDASKKIIFKNSGSISGTVNGCSCQVNAGANVTINSGVVLNLVNGLILQPADGSIPKATLTFEDGASLIQSNNDKSINSGDIIYKRNTTALNKFDYVYWGSPVVSQALTTTTFPNTDLYYSWTGSAWHAESGIMTPGTGYIIRSNAAVTQTTGTFVGVPNNGDVFYNSPSSTAAYCLIGNPYPSAVSADKFLTTNANPNGTTGGTLYFWTHNTARFQSGNQLVYSSNDYAAYNLTGQIRGVKAISDKSNPGKAPSGQIAAGQAFFIGNNSNGQFKFTNVMRSTGSTDNSQFFRQSSTKKSATVEKSRIWLNLTNDGGAFKQLLVGYITGATNDYDNLYDGASYNGNSYVDFYSLNSGKNLTIQGRRLPFDPADVVPLGYKTTIAGTFQISIDDLDGSMVDQPIYLEDKLTGKTQDLKSGDYSFTTAIGTFKDRFVLRYTDTSKLGTKDFDVTGKGVVVSVKNSQIKVNSFDENIAAIKVYDLKGSSLYEKNKVNKNEFTIDHLASSEQFLIVMVQLENGKWITEEIIFHD